MLMKNEIVPLKKQWIEQTSEDFIERNSEALNVVCSIYETRMTTKLMRVTFEFPDVPEVASALAMMMGRQLRLSITYSYGERVVNE
ncbi:MAG: hypothetical protein BWK79_04930 [Beggiatoa sp. IS2]|nr:MAG: hypothetical protein BWK79_04930 [Beggiatoa sp. IS2]